ncbi:MAG: DUF4832 domain-containing protein, partial [Victivallales bacterium]|nr:DUF4832 domain-containing protein [Victivallales bacterium]
KAIHFSFKTDVRRWYGGGTRQVLEMTETMPKDMPKGEYQVGFALPDAAESLAERAEYAIRCANPLSFTAGINWLGQLTIHNA